MSSPSRGPPPPGGDRNNGPAILGVLWTETAIAILIVAARFHARILIRKISWDDWLMLVTLLLFIGCSIFSTIQATIGGDRHVYYLSEQVVINALKWNFILRGLDILAYATGKAAIGALILRLLERQSVWQKWVVWVVVIVTAIINILNCIFNFVQCIPVQANWTPGIPAKCWAPMVQIDFAYFMSSENIVADVILALLPATFLFGLNMDRRKQINLSILLGLGLMAAVCGIVKTTQLASISNDPDFTWSEYALTLWGLSEIFVIIVCGTVPTLKVLWDRHFVSRKHTEVAGAYYHHAYDMGTRVGTSRHHTKILDSESQTECIIPLEGKQMGIRATTEIDVVSERERG